MEFKLADGGTVVVETDEPEPGGLQRSGRDRKIDDASQSYEEALEQVMPAAERTVQRLQGLSWRPDGVALEFGVKFSVKSGAIIASTALEANLKITLTWAEARSPAVDAAGSIGSGVDATEGDST